MVNWTYDPNNAEEQSYSPLPVGDYRVRIESVVEKTFKSNNTGFEIEFAVSGKKKKIWYYLVLDAANPKRTNGNLKRFFECFGITDTNLQTYTNWIGKAGACHTKNEEYGGKTNPKVHWFIERSKQDALPAWVEPDGGSGTSSAPAAQPTAGSPVDITQLLGEDGDLPF